MGVLGHERIGRGQVESLGSEWDDQEELEVELF